MTEAKLSYRRITEKIAGKLDLLEAYLFYCLALCSDCYTAISHIKQVKLAAFYGITKEEQIGKWLHKFEDMRLIKIHSNLIKGKYGTFSRYEYELDTEHYVLIGNTLYDEPISRELKGFLVLLKCKCLNGTNTCKYSQKMLAEELGLSTSTISRYIRQATELGYVKKDKKGIHLLDKDIFLITSETQIAILKNVYPEILTDEDIARGYCC